MLKCRKSTCQLSIVTQKSRRASSERFHALPSTTLSNFHSDSLDRLLRNGLFVSRHGYWTELSGPLCWFVSRHGYWNVEKQKSCQLSISLRQSGTGCGSPGWGSLGCGSPLLPTGLTLVHFYPQVWHQSTFIHRSDTSPLLPTGLTLVHFYPQVWH